MKKNAFQIFPSLILIVFLGYWLGVFILAFSSNPVKTFITHKGGRFAVLFSNSWKLFTPPYTYNNRLYFIVRNIDGQNMPDTIEVLENISLQKQRSRPFYQRENIIDHIVNHYVLKLTSTGLQNLKIATAVDNTKDSLYKYPLKGTLLKDEEYDTNLATLINYSKIVLKEKHLNTVGKEIKIVIAEQPIKPFKQLNDKQFVPKEILQFETPYKPMNP